MEKCKSICDINFVQVVDSFQNKRLCIDYYV
jgi:hypothetical protein